MPSHQCSSKTNSTELQPKRELVRFAFLEVLAKFTTLIRAELCVSPHATSSFSSQVAPVAPLQCSATRPLRETRSGRDATVKKKGRPF